MGTAAQWRRRAKSIVHTALEGQAREVKVAIAKLLLTDPELSDLDQRLMRAWVRKDKELGDFALDRFAILLRSRVEKLETVGADSSSEWRRSPGPAGLPSPWASRLRPIRGVE
jgi:hypothetical protein